MILSTRFAIRELHHALAVEPNVMQPCRVCGSDYTPVAASYIVCSQCFTRMRRRLSFHEIVLGLGCKALVGEVQAMTAPVDPDA